MREYIAALETAEAALEAAKKEIAAAKAALKATHGWMPRRARTHKDN
jgi:multidrug resistance efflux pump